MTQGSLLATAERLELTPERLIGALQGLGWTHRADLALRLGVSIRAVREAAQKAGGHVLSGNAGLMLTKRASREEVLEATGRFRSQIKLMQQRVYETERIAGIA